MAVAVLSRGPRLPVPRQGHRPFSANAKAGPFYARSWLRAMGSQRGLKGDSTSSQKGLADLGSLSPAGSMRSLPILLAEPVTPGQN